MLRARGGAEVTLGQLGGIQGVLAKNVNSERTTVSCHEAVVPKDHTPSHTQSWAHASVLTSLIFRYVLIRSTVSFLMGASAGSRWDSTSPCW